VTQEARSAASYRQRPTVEKPSAIFQTVSELDISHLRARRSASAKGSLNACETFCGLLAHTNAQKVSQPFKDHNHLLAVGEGGAETVPKGHPQKVGLEASESSLFQSSESFLAKKIGAAAGCRCLKFASV
jgi:hypothetical protein